MCALCCGYIILHARRVPRHRLLALLHRHAGYAVGNIGNHIILYYQITHDIGSHRKCFPFILPTANRIESTPSFDSIRKNRSFHVNADSESSKTAPEIEKVVF